VSEETGFVVEIDLLTGVNKNMTNGIIALVFRCHASTAPCNPHRKASEATWLTSDDVRERMSAAFAIRLLDAIEDHADGPAVRTRRHGSAHRHRDTILTGHYLTGAR
jgi:8-oxo-dGTP diphosphatase